MTWPTEVTAWLLFLGFMIPVLYFVRDLFNIGLRNAISLRSLTLGYIWYGYFLSPTLALFSGNWWPDNFIYSEYIDRCLITALIGMISFAIGYEIAVVKIRKRERKENNNIKLDEWKLKPENVPLFSFSFFAILSSVYISNGIAELWASEYERGSVQFVSGSYSSLQLMMASLHNLFCVVFIVIAVECIIVSFGRRRDFINVVRAALTLFSSSIILMAQFSRGCGLAPLILGLVALKKGGHRYYVAGIVCFILAIWMNAVGLYYRDSKPGLGNYFSAFSKSTQESNWPEVEFGPGVVLHDAVGSWTVKAFAKDVDRPEVMPNVRQYFINLIPLPSNLIGYSPIGGSIHDQVGVTGSIGITTPTFAELYYIFGIFGVSLFFFWGFLFAYVDKVYNQRNFGWIGTSLFLLCFASVSLGVHSDSRTSTRGISIVLAVIIWLIYKNKKRITNEASSRY